MDKYDELLKRLDNFGIDDDATLAAAAIREFRAALAPERTVAGQEAEQSQRGDSGLTGSAPAHATVKWSESPTTGWQYCDCEGCPHRYVPHIHTNTAPMLDNLARKAAPASPLLPSEEDTNRACANALERVAIIKAKHAARKAADLLPGRERDAERYRARRYTIYKDRLRIEMPQGKNWRPTTFEDFCAEYDAACDKEIEKQPAEISRLKGEGRGA